MTHLLPDTYLDYSDILIKPKMGINLNSRKDVDLNRTFKFKYAGTRTGLGVMNANMATVGNFSVSKKLLMAGMFATLQKHYSLDEIASFLTDCKNTNVNYDNLFLTIGLRNSDEEIEKLKQLAQIKYINKDGEEISLWGDKKNICIDAPNFYIPKALDCLKRLRDEFPDALIMVGNIASSDICLKLLDYTDIVKASIGSGSACTTRKQTGVGTPMVSLILECADAVHSVNGHLCADGGIVNIGDISKAFCLNSDFVMIGGMFAGCDEAEGKIIEKHFQLNEIDPETNKFLIEIKKYKQFYGMSSEYANNKFAGGMSDYKTSEGRELLIPYTDSIDKIIQDIRGGVASCCTYIGANSVKSMSKCATIIKVHNQLNTVFEKYSDKIN